MDERSTDTGREKTAEEVHGSTEAVDPAGMGSVGKRGRVAERHGIHPMTLYRWRKRLETGAAEFLKGTRPRVDPRMRELEQENQKLRDTVTLLSQELMALKKKMNLV